MASFLRRIISLLLFKNIICYSLRWEYPFIYTSTYHPKNYILLVTKKIHTNIAKEVYTTSDRSIGLSSRTCLKDALVVQKFAYSRNIYTDQENWTMQLFLHLQKVLFTSPKKKPTPTDDVYWRCKRATPIDDAKWRCKKK